MRIQIIDYNSRITCEQHRSLSPFSVPLPPSRLWLPPPDLAPHAQHTTHAEHTARQHRPAARAHIDGKDE